MKLFMSFYHLFASFGSESKLLCWNSTVCVSGAANREIGLQEVKKFGHRATDANLLIIVLFVCLSDKSGVTSVSLFLCFRVLFCF